jgi:Cu/Ag efflux protein CusF
MMKNLIGRAALVAALLSMPAAAMAQKPVTIGETITESFTIEAIDQTARIVTLKDKDGFLEDLLCGPEVERFNALKVGQTVTFRYTESLVSAIRRPGEATRPAATGGVTRIPGDKPGGTMSAQLTTTVKLDAIDAKVPSVSVTTKDGRKMSFKVQDAKNLTGYKVGDTVEITYTQALAISVK